MSRALLDERYLRARTVACLGSSSTAGKGQAFDWIGELARRPRNARFNFLNFGVGGDLACDALKRADTVLAVRPYRVIAWVGGNDALAMISAKARAALSDNEVCLQTFVEVQFDECFRTLVC